MSIKQTENKSEEKIHLKGLIFLCCVDFRDYRVLGLVLLSDILHDHIFHYFFNVHGSSKFHLVQRMMDKYCTIFYLKYVCIKIVSIPQDLLGRSLLKGWPEWLICRLNLTLVILTTIITGPKQNYDIVTEQGSWSCHYL